MPLHRMDTDDDVVVHDFIDRLDKEELNLSDELPKLSYEQLLGVARILEEQAKK